MFQNTTKLKIDTNAYLYIASVIKSILKERNLRKDT